MNKIVRYISVSILSCIYLVAFSGCSETEKLKTTTYKSIISVGDTISMGKYEQDNDLGNGAEDIKWRVLAIEDTKALLISECSLDALPYNTKETPVTWEECSLRLWLNDTFLNTAFSSEEQSAIILAKIENDSNSRYYTYSGDPTEDRVFLLSESEASEYFSQATDRISPLTEFIASKDGFMRYSNGNSWWLRSPGDITFTAETVAGNGQIDVEGESVDYSDVTVRPALYLDLTSNIFTNTIASNVNINSQIYEGVTYLEQTTSLEDMKSITDLDEWVKLSAVDRAAYFLLTNEISCQGYPIDSINLYTNENTFNKSIGLFGVGAPWDVFEAASYKTGLESKKLASAMYYYTVLPSGDLNENYESLIKELKVIDGHGTKNNFEYVNNGTPRQTGRDALNGNKIIFTNVSIQKVVTETQDNNLGEVIVPEYTVQLIEVPIRLENGMEVMFYMIGDQVDGEASPDADYPY